MRRKRKQPTCKNENCGRDLGEPPKSKGQPSHYCSRSCREEAQRKQTYARVQRFRERQRKAQALLLLLSILAWGCSASLIPQSYERSPAQYEVQREWTLPYVLDDVHTAVVAVYARMMLPVEQMTTKDGPSFRLINAQRLAVSADQAREYADCGVRFTGWYREDYKRHGFSNLKYKTLIDSAKTLLYADTMAFNVFLQKQGTQSLMRVETSFNFDGGGVCQSRGAFEQLLYTNILSELSRNE